MIDSPTAASAAATAMTKSTNTCPPIPNTCANATKVRFTALSMSSTHMKITMALRRNRTPATPMVNRIAEIARAELSTLEFPLREHDGAHDCREQQHARDFERNQIRVEQRIGDRPDDPALLLQCGHRARGKLNRSGER